MTAKTENDRPEKKENTPRANGYAGCMKDKGVSVHLLRFKLHRKHPSLLFFISRTAIAVLNDISLTLENHSVKENLHMFKKIALDF